MPKSGEVDVKTAPRLTAASIATSVSGMFGMNAATQSPGPTPCARSAAAVTATWRRNCARDDAAPDLVLAPEDDRVRVRIDVVAQQVLGEIQACVGKPARARHPVAIDQDTLDRARRCTPTEGPHEAPESLRLVDRPSPERVVVGERTDRDTRSASRAKRCIVDDCTAGGRRVSRSVRNRSLSRTRTYIIMCERCV